MLLTGEVEGTGQKRSDGAAGGHRGDARLVEMLEMVGGEGIVVRGERGAMEVGELLGMELDGQAMGDGGGEDAVGLFGREADALAERVDGIGMADSGGDDRLADQVDIAIGIALIFGRDGVGGEQGGADVDVACFAEAARGAKHLELVVEGEAIARLDLDRGHTLRDQLIESGQGAGDQLVFARGASRGDGGENAAAGAGDLLIGRAFEPRLELPGAVAGMDEMGVAID